MSQMLVDMLQVNFTPTELENNLSNTFKVLHTESLIHWNPILDELTHPVLNESVDRAADRIMNFFLPNGVVPIMPPKRHRQ
jgi:hypothetical protein